MNKSDFTELIMTNANYTTKVEADRALKAVMDAITEVLVKKESVSLVGFGSFSSSVRAGKTGKIPGTDKTYTTQDKMVPSFKAGKTLKERVASGV